MKQVERNLNDLVDGFLWNATHPIHRRDRSFTQPFVMLGCAGVRTVKIPAKSANCSAYEECLVVDRNLELIRALSCALLQVLGHMLTVALKRTWKPFIGSQWDTLSSN